MSTRSYTYASHSMTMKFLLYNEKDYGNRLCVHKKDRKKRI